jgi:hypothetical protein
MINTILQLVYILLFPALALYLGKQTRIIKWLSPIVLCYLTGVIVGNISYFNIHRDFMTIAAEVSVGIAIPALLFSCNFIGWIKHSKNTFISFFLALLAVVLVSSACFFIFRNQIHESWKVAGMMIGVYTGGTANMTAIGIAVGVEEETFILLNSADLIFSGIYFLFLLTLGKKIFGFFLPAFKGFNSDKSQPPSSRGRLSTVNPRVLGAGCQPSTTESQEYPHCTGIIHTDPGNRGGCFFSYYRRIYRCIDYPGDYFAGDHCIFFAQDP